jgi:hypothetical protein
MPEFELDEESVSRAEKLSSRLMHDLREASEGGSQSETRRGLFSESRYSDEEEGVPLGDVVANVNQMAMEFATARRWDGEIPCLKLDDGGLAPISLTEFFAGPSSSFYGSEDWVELWDRYFGGPFPPHRLWREILKRSERQEERVVVSDVREAEAAVQRSLNAFLSYRFAGMKRWAKWIKGIGSDRPGGPPWWPFRRMNSIGGAPPTPAVSPGGGLRVQVSCNTRGLRIHVSPAYFISWVYFGSPTSPVVSYVLPGRYIFAGDGPMLPRRRKDPTVFCIPADYNPDLKRF